MRAIHESCEGWGMNMHEFKSVRMMTRTSVNVVKWVVELQVVKAFRKVMLQEGGVTGVAESELTLVAPLGSGGHSPFVACVASPSVIFDGIMGYLHPLESAGTIGLGPTSMLAGVVVTYELLSKLNSELHCLLPPL